MTTSRFHSISRFYFVRFGLILAGFCWAATTAEAAKGVKKTTLANGQQMLTGTVVAMAPDGHGGGSFQLKSAASHAKNGTANSTTATGSQTNALTGTQSGNYMMNTLHVTSSTQFQHQNQAANGKPLTVGSHVRVVATGNQAQSVQVLSNGGSSMNRFMRHRMSAYYPHVSHHHMHKR